MTKIINSYSREYIRDLYETPFFELVHQASSINQKFHTNEIELCVLVNIKTGGCIEDCAYCPQRSYAEPYDTVKRLDFQEVIQYAKLAKQKGITRFCMHASGSNPLDDDFQSTLMLIKAIKKIGIESCLSLGSISKEEAVELKNAGLDVYGHSLDTSPRYYSKIITSRSYQDRLDTLAHVAQAGIKICCGGILGMGESRDDRIDLLWQLCQLPTRPYKIPMNQLIPMPNTPLENMPPLDPIEFIRMLAVTRILFPEVIIASIDHLMSDEMQAFCLMIGANSISYGNDILNSPKSNQQYCSLLKRLNIRVKNMQTLPETLFAA
jgi:biotin synthase